MSKKSTTTRTYGRSRTYTPHFYMIASGHSAEFEDIMLKIDERPSGEPVPQELRRAQFTTGHIVVVFSCMCLEAFAYDYIATHYSDSYTKKYLDKMSLLQKLIIFPQLVTGQRFPTDQQVYQMIDDLITARNELVHYKSAPVVTSELAQLKSDEKIQHTLSQFPSIVRNAKKAVDAYVKTVVAMHPKGDHLIGVIKELIT